MQFIYGYELGVDIYQLAAAFAVSDLARTLLGGFRGQQVERAYGVNRLLQLLNGIKRIDARASAGGGRGVGGNTNIHGQTVGCGRVYVKEVA